MIAIARPYDNITVNEEVEYVLDDNGDIMKFDSVDDAKDFLRWHDVEEEVIDEWLMYVEV